jgi:2-polyprenylphenol 6-hydroxylase
MSRDFDVIVSGAGVAGASVAAALAIRGVAPPQRIALVADHFTAPPAPATDWDLRVFAISRASQRLLQATGAWAGIPAARCRAYERMCVWDAADAPTSAAALRFDAAELHEPDLGHIVEGPALQWAALEAARRAGVAMIEARVSAATFGAAAAQLQLADSRLLQASLVIGADGARSGLRTMAGIEARGHAYHQCGLVAHVRTAQPHRDTAWQRFLPTGPLALLPIDAERVSIVWSLPAPRAQELCEADAAAFEGALEEASGSVLGRCALSSGRASFPLQLQYAAEYVRPRLALLGDAAHAVHPLAGQGLNLGLRDAAALVEVLAGAPADALGELAVLRRYERQRKSDNLLAAAAFDGLNRLFSNSNPLLGRLRSAGLAAVGRLPPLKHLFAHAALGD